MRPVPAFRPPVRRSSGRRRRRRSWPAIAAAAVIAAVLPVAGASPAGADPAPLVTTDGLGIRVDETALTGPALDEIEAALQPFVDDMIFDGATAPGQPFGGHVGLDVSSNLELSLDFLTPGGAKPSGGLAVHADIQDILMTYEMDPIWPWDNCNIWVEPSDGTVDISAGVDKDRLPATPLELDPVQATWDDSPDVSSDGICWTYVAWEGISSWWSDIWDSSDPESTAARIQAELNATAQDLIDDLWADYVAPTLTSLDEGFGITVNQLRTDDHGLIVTANVDATGGVTIPGDPSSPRNVSSAQDSGADSDINALLANRTSADGDSHVIASIHPNVANQYLLGLNLALSGQFGGPVVPSTIEQVLLDPAVRGNYADNGWTVSLSTTNAQTAPFTEPTGAGGAPQLRYPSIFVIVRNTTTGSAPVAVFQGSMTGVALITEVREEPVPDAWGPGFDPSGAGVSLSLLVGNADVQAWGPEPGDMLPFAKLGVDYYEEQIFVTYVSIAPLDIGNLSVDLCTTCGRYAGDERYTETFKVT